MELTTIFYHIDNFCNIFEKEFGKRLLSNGQGLREKEMALTASEVMAILVYYHSAGYKNFKKYYKKSSELSAAFPTMPSYNRFIEIQQKVILPLALFAKLCSSNPCDGISFIDSFSLSVSHQKRISSHKTFRGIAARGKTSMGWFYGFKVHIVINREGEIADFMITPGNVADNNANVIEQLMKKIAGKVFGDKGYILKKEFWQSLYLQGKEIVTKIRSNMNNKLVNLSDKLMLQKRGVIESVGAVLKEDLNIEHSRYRNPLTLFINVFAALIAYQFRPKKPSIKCDKFEALAEIA